MPSDAIVLKGCHANISGEIHLNSSKSESNRALIVQALSEELIKINNLSTAQDTRTLQQLLTSHDTLLDVGHAGTAMRFLTAYLALKNQQTTITGSERMKKRPIGILVDALNHLGATISYLDKKGYPPIQVQGISKQIHQQVVLGADTSSQYISALLLIAPKLPMGLRLCLEGEIISKPYIQMTLAMLARVGVHTEWIQNCISIHPQSFKKSTLKIEPDWSAASYWYALAALASNASIFLRDLKKDSLQGDRVIAEIMAHFGIISEFKPTGVLLKKKSKKIEKRIFDFKECPDLAQTVIVCCAALKHDALFTGLESLKIKETNRIQALQNELSKLGVELIENNKTYYLNCAKHHLPNKISIKTYDDHRMAMAFAPLALVIPEVEIENKDVVEKSYPNFWNDFNSMIKSI